MIRSLLETMFLVSCRLFYILDTLVINIIYVIIISSNVLILDTSWESGYSILQFIIFIIFNVVESYHHYKYETESFYNMISANKLSKQYIKFVNRLLPKHVQIV